MKYTWSKNVDVIVRFLAIVATKYHYLPLVGDCTVSAPRFRWFFGDDELPLVLTDVVQEHISAPLSAVVPSEEVDLVRHNDRGS